VLLVILGQEGMATGADGTATPEMTVTTGETATAGTADETATAGTAGETETAGTTDETATAGTADETATAGAADETATATADGTTMTGTDVAGRFVRVIGTVRTFTADEIENQTGITLSAADRAMFENGATVLIATSVEPVR